VEMLHHSASASWEDALERWANEGAQIFFE